MTKIPFDIILFARDRWDDVWRRRHHLSVEFAARGRRVLFVEPPKWGESGSDRLREASHGIYVFTPRKTAPHALEPLRRADFFATSIQLGAAMRRLGIRRPVAWVTAEFAVHLLGAAAPRLTIYDVTDDWTQAPLRAAERAQIARDDAALLRQADLVFAVSETLAALKEKRHPDVRRLPNGVRLELYDAPLERPAELAPILGPIAGYVGTLHTDRLDVALIEQCATRAEGQFHFVFVGPNHLPRATTESLGRHENIHLIPPQPPDRVPAFVAAFDVCVIPHLVNPFTNSLDPIKLYEYFAAGKPVVSTPVAGVSPYLQFVDIAADSNAFRDGILSALAAGRTDATDRRAFARGHSWSARAQTALEWISAALPHDN